MRSSRGTKFELPLSVVVSTKSRIAFLADPAFHEGRGSAAAAEATEPANGADVRGAVEQPPEKPTKMSAKPTRVEGNAKRFFISFPPLLVTYSLALDWAFLT